MYTNLTNEATLPAKPVADMPRWHVMTHLDMSLFREWFDYVNAERLEAGMAIIQAFYPYEFIDGRLHDRVVVDIADDQRRVVRTDHHRVMRRFLFLKATAKDIEMLLYSKANIQSRLRLRRYLTPSGEQAVVNDGVMREFLTNCIKFRGRFELRPPSDGVAVNTTVRILAGPYVGYEATVERARLDMGTLSFDVAIPMVSGQICVELKDVAAGDVQAVKPADATALRKDFIRYTQDSVLELLKRKAAALEHEERERRRFSRKTSDMLNDRMTPQRKHELQPFLEDSDVLERLLRYRDYEVAGFAAKAHLKALMLICAHLSHDTALAEQLTDTVKGMLRVDSKTGDWVVRTDADAYLCIALKVVTNDPNYRDKVKDYMRERNPKSRKLRDFVGLIRKNVRY